MSSKDHRNGGKFNGNHTTLIPVAIIVADLAATLPEVTKVSPGFIKSGIRSANVQRRVKLATEKTGVILLSIRDHTSHQELHVYTKNSQKTLLAIAKGARNVGIKIAFTKRK